MFANPHPSTQDIVDRAYRRAKDLVQQNISVLHECADLLMEREQIDGEDLQVRLGGGEGFVSVTRVCGLEGQLLVHALVQAASWQAQHCSPAAHCSKLPSYPAFAALPLVPRRRCWWRRRLSST